MRGLENPLFYSVFKGSENGVQLFTLEVPPMGFNYAPVGIYIYIHIYAVGGESGHLRVLIWSPRRFPLQNQAFLLGEKLEI